jgi:hypothetical protein
MKNKQNQALKEAIEISSDSHPEPSRSSDLDQQDIKEPRTDDETMMVPKLEPPSSSPPLVALEKAPSSPPESKPNPIIDLSSDPATTSPQNTRSKVLTSIGHFEQITIWNPDHPLDLTEDVYARAINEWVGLSHLVGPLFLLFESISFCLFNVMSVT